VEWKYLRFLYQWSYFRDCTTRNTYRKSDRYTKQIGMLWKERT